MDAHIIAADFHGQKLTLVEHQGQPYAVMKPIVEGMGMAWQAQLAKLSANKDRWGITEIVIPSNGGDQSTVGIPLRKLPGWMTSIHANKVRAEIREQVITYQNECDDALWDYWTKGQATNPRTEPEAANAPGKFALSAEELTALVEVRVKNRLAGARYHYPREMLEQDHFITSRDGFNAASLSIKMFASEEYHSSNPGLYDELERNGHDVSACRVEYEAMRENILSADKFLEEMMFSIIGARSQPASQRIELSGNASPSIRLVA